MHKISTKLAAYFIITFLLLETVLMVYLHQNIIHARVDEEFSRLLASGSNHRNVLANHYSEETMDHIVLMEAGKDREVMIIGVNKEIIRSSDENIERYASYLSSFQSSEIKNDQIFISDWKNSSYIVSAHPYNVGADQSGYVVMFQSSLPLELLVKKLNEHFALAGGAGMLILLIIYSMLSKFLTRPLIRMKEATEKLSEGDFDVSLPAMGNDELGELSIGIMKLANDLDRMKKERNEFLASISHELSTPLTYLIGYLKVAMRDGLTEQERNYYLQIIAEESNRMKELVKNLMDLAKMDGMMFTVTKEDFSAAKFMAHIHKLVSSAFNLKKIELNVICLEDFHIHADPLRLEQITLNLLDNALKYSNEHTKVTFEICKEKNYTVLSVTDEGIGIPLNESELIFEKLYRIEKSRSRAFGGSGLGLPIVKELVEAHGGTIDLKSVVGEGSTFTIKI